MSKFKSDDIESVVVERVNRHLDAEVDSLSSSVAKDISQARMNALRQARTEKESSWTFTNWLPSWQVSTPVAVAVMVAILVSYESEDQIPAIPSTMFTENIPAEDLDMLEDYEFAAWLAEQDIEVTS